MRWEYSSAWRRRSDTTRSGDAHQPSAAAASPRSAAGASGHAVLALLSRAARRPPQQLGRSHKSRPGRAQQASVVTDTDRPVAQPGQSQPADRARALHTCTRSFTAILSAGLCVGRMACQVHPNDRSAGLQLPQYKGHSVMTLAVRGRPGTWYSPGRGSPTAPQRRGDSRAERST